MNFFIFVPSVMAVCIFLIHHFTEYVGLNIKYQSLFLCAVISLMVNVVSIFLSDFLNINYYIHLVVFIIAGAVLVNFYNAWLIRRDEMKNIMSSVDEAAERREAESIQMLEQEKSKQVAKAIKSTEPDELQDDSEIERQLFSLNKVENKTHIEPKIEIENVPQIVENSTVENKIEVEITPESEESQFDLEFNSLDDYLEFARIQHDKKNYSNAIEAYTKAIEKYSSDEYAPFVAIEVGNIYKEQAEYAKAIKTYEDAMELPALKNDLEARLEFSRNLLYLRTVQLVLLQHDSLQTPYSKIPKDYMDEIEKTFAERIAK